MVLNRFLVEREPAWAELGGLLDRTRGRARSLSAPEVRRLGALYREVTADLAVARRRFSDDPVTDRLESLVARSRVLVYGTATRRESLAGFLARGYWRRVRERPVFLLVSGLLLWGSALGVGTWASGHPSDAVRVAQVSPLTAGLGNGGPTTADKQLGTSQEARLSSQIFTNNMRVSLIAFAGGLTGGVLTAASLVFNGLVVGLVVGVSSRMGTGSVVLRLVIPHGLLELSLITVAGAAGLRTGWALIRPGHRRRTEALAVEGRAGIEMAIGSAVWLIPCGLVEGFVTPRGLSLVMASVVGVSLALLFWALVLWLGRPARPPAVRAEPGP